MTDKYASIIEELQRADFFERRHSQMDGAACERRQTVCAENFRMVSAARHRGALRIPNAAFLISTVL